MNEVILLDNGLRLCFENLPYAHSVCIGIFFGAGSRRETADINGISHLLEHICFKGTAKRTAFEIVSDVDALGANINAYTTKELTAYYIQSIREYVDDAAEILSDLVLHHTIPEDELEREKEVVIEEINMCEDTPDDVANDLVAAAFWGESPLSRPILGTVENVRRFTREDIFDYQNRYYVSRNCVISITGDISREEAIALVRKYFDVPDGYVEQYKEETPALVPTVKSAVKDIEQANICIAYRGLGFSNKDDLAAIILSAVFGGNMSSVLFQILREQMSLAYSVSSYDTAYVGDKTGAFNIYIGTSNEKAKVAVSKILEIVENYRKNGFSEEEFKRGYNQLKGSYMMGFESPLTLMRVYAKYALAGEKFDLDAIYERLKQVTCEDVNRIFRSFTEIKPSVGYVGKQPDFDLEKLFYGDNK